MTPFKLQTAALIFLISFASTTSCLPTAVIDSGTVIGTITSLPSATATVNKFLGIPFAASPPQRFSPPAKVASWYEPLDATVFKPACIQQFDCGFSVIFLCLSLLLKSSTRPCGSQKFHNSCFDSPEPVESEDCLYLNVFVPSKSPPHGGYPVMFWVYGGSLEFGNAGQPAYDGSGFAAFEEVIVVTINYRTNVFGFPNSPELPFTGQNLGFLDQRAALNWVQSNIRAFGGNPRKVTIFGESAGAESVDALVTSLPHNLPFRAAILESGAVVLADDLSLGLNSTASWLSLVSALNCSQQVYTSDLTCVRAAKATTIQSIIEHEALIFQPVRDNMTLLSNPSAVRAAGNIARVPVLTGTNGQEVRVFEFGQTNLTAFIQTTFGGFPALAAEITQAYAVGTDGTTDGFEAISQIFTELVFQCPAALMANLTAAAGIPAWRYYFNATFPNTQPTAALGVNLGAYHSAEIPVVFGTFPQPGATTQEIELSKFMRGVWAKFAKDPHRGPGWSRWDGRNLGVLGSNGSTGVVVIPASKVDYRCPILEPVILAE